VNLLTRELVLKRIKTEKCICTFLKNHYLFRQPYTCKQSQLGHTVIKFSPLALNVTILGGCIINKDFCIELSMGHILKID
jgi:hypothetical protein